MKKATLLLALGAAIVLFGCSKENAVTPDQGDMDYQKYKTVTYFEGVSFPDPGTLDPGQMTILPNGKIKISNMTAKWFDASDNPYDPNIYGETMIEENWIIEADGSMAKIWGKSEFILTDVEGTWQSSWHGYLYAYEGHNLLEPVPYPFCTGTCKVNGQGKTGVVKGLVMSGTYEMDSDGTEENFVWNFSGTYH